MFTCNIEPGRTTDAEEKCLLDLRGPEPQPDTLALTKVDVRWARWIFQKVAAQKSRHLHSLGLHALASYRLFIITSVQSFYTELPPSS